MSWLPNLFKEIALLVRELRLLQPARFYLLLMLAVAIFGYALY